VVGNAAGAADGEGVAKGAVTVAEDQADGGGVLVDRGQVHDAVVEEVSGDQGIGLAGGTDPVADGRIEAGGAALAQDDADAGGAVVGRDDVDLAVAADVPGGDELRTAANAANDGRRAEGAVAVALKDVDLAVGVTGD